MGKVCCFAGHADIFGEEGLYDKTKEIIYELIVKEDVVDFYVGRYGKYDWLATKVLLELKKICPYIRIFLVIPYLKKDITRKNGEICNYDDIIIADMPENTPAKYKILMCNRYMVEHSDFLVAFVNYSWGGAAKTIEYAQKKKHIKIINLGIREIKRR